MTDGDGDESGGVAVSLRPTERSVAPGEEARFELVVEGAERGISAYESAVHVDDGARITYAELTGDPAVPVADIIQDDSVAVVAAAMGPDSDHTAAEIIPIAEVTLCGETPGSAVELAIEHGTEVAPVDDDIDRYPVTQCGTGTLRIVDGDGRVHSAPDKAE